MQTRNVWVTLGVLLLLLAVALVLRTREPAPHELFARQPAHLYFYAFALCRMQCLSFSKTDVERLLQTGIINLGKSNRRARPCPIFALQGRVNGRALRVLFEQCRTGTYVLNCYNLQTDTACNCTLDYKPAQP